jgi:hypothetical protein
MARRKGDYTRSRKAQPQGRVKIWAAIRFLKRFDLEDLQVTTECEYQNCHKYTQALYRVGVLNLEVKPAEIGQRFTFRLDPRFMGVEAPIPQKNGQVFDPNRGQVLDVIRGNPKNSRERAWEAMRELHHFTQPQLARAAKCTKDNLCKYLRSLLVAGYLEVVQPGMSSPKVAAVYRLIRNTGAKTPVVQRDGTILDPNLKGEGNE